MRRLLVLNYEFPPLGGGASPVSYEIVKGLSEGGEFDVDVVTMGYKGLPSYEEINDRLRIHRVKSWRSKKEVCHPWEQATYLFSGYRKCVKLFSKKKYNICHCHFIIPTGIIALMLKRRFGLDYIITSHGSDVPGFNSDRFKFLHNFTGPILKKVCAFAKIITTPSKYLAELIKKNIGEYKMKVIPNGSRDFYLSGVEKGKIIFSSGRLLRRKGFQYLIQSFKKIKKSDWKLVIAGDGPYKTELQKLSEGEKNIFFTGWLDNKSKEYIELFNKAKIFALLSESESQGIVYVEAMSAGCAILASDTTACTETVPNDVGFLVERNNIDLIAEKLELLINEEYLLEKFSKNSRTKYKNFYSWNKIIGEYEVLLLK